MARTSVHEKLLAAMDAAAVEEKEEDVPIAELLRRERQKEQEAKDAAAEVARQIEARAEAERQLEIELAEFAKKEEEARLKKIEDDKVAARWAALAEMERKTKRFFDVDDSSQRQLEITTTGGVYFGEYEVLGDDWRPHGFGEFRMDTGAVVYEGEWSRGQGRKRVIQRRFNVGVLEAIPKRKASTLCARPER